MKITPITGPSMPNAQMTTTSNTVDRIMRAKAIAAGETPHETTGNEQVDKLKSITMRTNASPDRPIENLLEAETQSPNLDTNVEASVAEETKPLSPQLAAFARQKRALQVKERELAEREAKLNSQSGSSTSDELIAKLKANPLSVLQENGVTYDQLTEAILSNPINPEIGQLKDELKALKEELTQQFTTRDKQAEDQVSHEWTLEANRMAADGDTYQFIREAEMIPDVIEGIKAHWRATGELNDLVDTMNKLEERLVENALKAAQIKKVQARLTPSLPEDPQEMPRTPGANVKQMRTLTSRDNARPIGSDRRSRAMAAFHGQFKKG